MMGHPMKENPMMVHPVVDYGIGMYGNTIIEYNFGFVLDLSKRRNG